MKPPLSLDDLLSTELRRRQSANPAYSLRAFARDLRVSPGFLSEVMKGEKRLSSDRASEIARRLGYGPGQLEAVSRTDLSPKDRVLPLDQFAMIADWYHGALLDLTLTQDFQAHPDWIARRLGISRNEAEGAVQRLLRLGLLKKTADGQLVKKRRHLRTPSDIPSRALRLLHSQMLEKAKAALEGQAVEKRDITSLTLSIDTDLIPEVKREIARFRERIARIAARQGTRPDSVYQMQIAFFELTQNTQNQNPNQEK